MSSDTGETWTYTGGVYVYQPAVKSGTKGPYGFAPRSAVTNVSLASETFSNATYWTPANAVIDANVGRAPTGELTADRMNVTAGAGITNLVSAAARTITDGATFYRGVRIKSDGSGRYIQLRAWASTNNWVAVAFDLSLGTVTQSSAGATSGTNVDSRATRLADGWVLCEILGSLGAGIVSVYESIGALNTGTPTLDTDGSLSFTPTAGADYLLWGAMCVNSTTIMGHAYIPTTTIAVAQTADVMIGTDTDWLPNNGGTIMGEIVTGPAVQDGVILQLDDATANNTIALEIVSGALTGTIVSAAGAGAAITGTTLAANTMYHVAIAFAANDVELYIDGVSDGTDLTCVLPTDALTKARAGNDEASGLQPNVPVGVVNVFTSRLTTAQIAGYV